MTRLWEVTYHGRGRCRGGRLLGLWRVFAANPCEAVEYVRSQAAQPITVDRVRLATLPLEVAS